MFAVYAISDGTGRTVDQVIRSAMVQFDGAPVRIIRRPHVRTEEQIAAVVEEAAAAGTSLIVHTLVSDALRTAMLAEARRRGVDAMDLMGPVLERLATHLKLKPRQKPGLFQQLSEARLREIEAVAFAFRHDDGQYAEELDRAEIVLVGPSRSMKTPITLYLAYRGWFAANVPVVLDAPLPQSVPALPPERVFCLLTSAETLVELRRARAQHENIPLAPYATLPHVRRELSYTAALAEQYGWQSVYVTGKSVEELCREIIGLLEPALVGRASGGPPG